MSRGGGGNPLLTFNTISTWPGADTHRNNDTAHRSNNMGPPAPPSLETQDGGDMFYFQPPIPSLARNTRQRGYFLQPVPHLLPHLNAHQAQNHTHAGVFSCSAPFLCSMRRSFPLLVTVYYYNYIKIKLIKNPPNTSCGYGLGVVPQTRPIPVPAPPIPGYPHGFTNP